jgi:hypothetical protein
MLIGCQGLINAREQKDSSNSNLKKNYSYSLSNQLLIYIYPSYPTPRMVVMKLRKPSHWEKILAIVVGISLGILISTSANADK